MRLAERHGDEEVQQETRTIMSWEQEVLCILAAHNLHV